MAHPRLRSGIASRFFASHREVRSDVFASLLLLCLTFPACAQSQDSGAADATIRSVESQVDPALRESMILQLASQDADTPDLWEGLLAHRDPEIARSTALALTRTAGRTHWRDPSPRVIEALSRATAHPDAGVRARSIPALAALHPDDPAIAKVLLPRISDGDAGVRSSALASFRILGPAVSPSDALALRAALPSEDMGVDAALALAACGQSPPAVIDALLEACCDRAGREAAMQAAIALGRLGPLAASAAQGLAETMEAAPPEVSREIAVALGLMGNSAGAVLPSLERARRAGMDGVSEAAALSLALLGERGEEIEGALQAGRKSRNSLYAAMASEGLLVIGEDPAAWSCLERSIRDPLDLAPTRVFSTAAVLRRIGAGRRPSEGVLGALELAKADREVEVRRAAARALAALEK